MKKKFNRLACVALLTLGLSSCAVIPTTVGAGALFTSVTEAGAVTSNTVGHKVGVASASNILGLIVLGDASINTAAKNAGIKKISHVDVRKNSILGIFSTTEVVVYGE